MLLALRPARFRFINKIYIIRKNNTNKYKILIKCTSARLAFVRIPTHRNSSISDLRNFNLDGEVCREQWLKLKMGRFRNNLRNPHECESDTVHCYDVWCCSFPGVVSVCDADASAAAGGSTVPRCHHHWLRARCRQSDQHIYEVTLRYPNSWRLLSDEAPWLQFLGGFAMIVVLVLSVQLDDVAHHLVI